jgi:hypothetical protein
VENLSYLYQLAVLTYFVKTFLLLDSKNILDEDDRDIRLLQEQFLPDGDLHSDGFGRMRRFRWQNAGKIKCLLVICLHDCVNFFNVKVAFMLRPVFICKIY